MPPPYPRNSDLLPGPIRGITRTSLWKSWKQVRKEVKNSSIRDVIDFFDYDVNPDVWINRLLARIASGEYEPETPRRFTLGKSKGFSRTMALPLIPDLVLYRTIVEYIYKRSRGRRHKNVYFLRDELSKAQKKALDDALGRMEKARDIENVEGDYVFTGRRSFYNWLRFNQYRKLLIHADAHPFIVVTDIANFFDTVLHSHVTEAVQSLSVPPRMIGLLFYLLERLSIRQDYSSSHGISLPTDEFDCSRTLAHLMLFPHDDAMVQLVGEDKYVRWMDDQNFAVETKAKGLQVLAEVGRSLSRLHLTPNAQKSGILTLEEARRHYHLDLNQFLDEAEILAKKSKNSPTAHRRFVTRVRIVWRKARPHEGVGEFGKVLKRLYRLAGLARLDIFRNRASSDVLQHPSLVARIADYYRCTGSVGDYLDFVESLTTNGEQVYPDVNVALIESLLRLEPQTGDDLLRLRKLAKALLQRKHRMPGAEDCAAIAPLLILRYGDKRLHETLRPCFREKRKGIARQIVRASAVVYASSSDENYRDVRNAAAAVLRNYLSSLVLLIAEIKTYTSVPGRYKSRLTLSFDPVSGQPYVDMRVILTARMLLLSRHRVVRDWVLSWRAESLAKSISDFDRRLLRRLVRL